MHGQYHVKLMVGLKHRCVIVLLYYWTSKIYLATIVFFFVENLPENGGKRPGHVGDLSMFVHHCT